MELNEPVVEAGRVDRRSMALSASKLSKDRVGGKEVIFALQ